MYQVLYFSHAYNKYKIWEMYEDFVMAADCKDFLEKNGYSVIVNDCTKE